MFVIFIVLAAFLPALAQSSDAELVPVKQIVPDIILDIRYATENNFTSQKLLQKTN